MLIQSVPRCLTLETARVRSGLAGVAGEQDGAADVYAAQARPTPKKDLLWQNHAARLLRLQVSASLAPDRGEDDGAPSRGVVGLVDRGLAAVGVLVRGHEAAPEGRPAAAQVVVRRCRRATGQPELSLYLVLPSVHA